MTHRREGSRKPKIVKPPRKKPNAAKGKKRRKLTGTKPAAISLEANGQGANSKADIRVSRKSRFNLSWPTEPPLILM